MTECTGQAGEWDGTSPLRQTRTPEEAAKIEELKAAIRRPEEAPAVPGLREQYAAAMREHYLVTNRAEADADGNLPCRCGDWREPGQEGDDENDWDSHLADVVHAVRDTEMQRLRADRDDLLSESLLRGTIILERGEKIRALESEINGIRRQLGAEILRTDQAEDLLVVAHETSHTSERERARAAQRAEELAADLRYLLDYRGPGHAHEVPGQWDHDGSPCGYCARLEQARQHLAAIDSPASGEGR